jgi:tRNA U34 5-methylaminomethyl-2-thiouridine-forming methyltransferase MnmC
VFIDQGLSACSQKRISILEVGFGTGLNALITLAEARQRKLTVVYTGVEAYPVSSDEIKQLNYTGSLGMSDLEQVYKEMHTVPWEKEIELTEQFSLIKQKKDFRQIKDEDAYDLVYFDAFGARVQPELWTADIFRQMFKALRNNGILVTYSAKGSVRRAMQEVGFEVERLPGPPGKREMLRARKP